jgi:hypothetical protein
VIYVIDNTNGMLQVINGVHAALLESDSEFPLAAPRRPKPPISIGAPLFPSNLGHTRLELFSNRKAAAFSRERHAEFGPVIERSALSVNFTANFDLPPSLAP